MRWSENQTHQFVTIYLSHNLLWNHEHAYNRLKSKRSKAYREIISQFYDITGIKLTETELKIKIKNLRSTYSQEVAKIRQRSASDWQYKPSLKWFSAWHKCFVAHKRSSDDISYDDVPNEDNACPEAWVPNDDNETGITNPFPDTDDDYKLIVIKADHMNSSESMPEPESSYNTNNKKMKPWRTSTDYSDKTGRDSIHSTESEIREDEFDIYGKYIASQLRKMHLHKALKVQMEIQTLVSEARLSDLSNLD